MIALILIQFFLMLIAAYLFGLIMLGILHLHSMDAPIYLVSFSVIRSNISQIIYVMV